MQEFIKLVTATLGTTEQTARAATASLFQVLANTAPAGELQKLVSRIPGASEFVKLVQPAAPPPPPSVIGSLTDLMTNAATVVQGAMGGGTALLSLLTQVGLDPQKATQFFQLFVEFARAQAGPEIVDKVISAIPGAKSLLS